MPYRHDTRWQHQTLPVNDAKLTRLLDTFRQRIHRCNCHPSTSACFKTVVLTPGDTMILSGHGGITRTMINVVLDHPNYGPLAEAKGGNAHSA